MYLLKKNYVFVGLNMMISMIIAKITMIHIIFHYIYFYVDVISYN